MDSFFEQVSNVRFYEVDKQGRASSTAILALLEEAAAEHCHSIGRGLLNLKAQNIGWVLTSGTIDMIRYPEYREKITIKTWVSKYSVVRGHRENIIFDEDKNIIGRAKGLWVFYDIQKKRPVPIFDDIKVNWGVDQKTSVDGDLGILDSEGEGQCKKEFTVQRYDVDSYNHLNNIRYFYFLLESLPEEIVGDYTLKVINARFLSEAQYGQKIQVYLNSDLKNHNFVHTMKSNGKVLAKAHTVWERNSA